MSLAVYVPLLDFFESSSQQDDGINLLFALQLCATVALVLPTFIHSTQDLSVFHPDEMRGHILRPVKCRRHI